MAGLGVPLVLLAGGGISVGVLSQLWPWAVGTVAGLGVVAYLGGYQHMITLSRWGVLLLLSGAIAFSITWLLGPVPYAHIDLRSGQSIGHQIIFGAVIGIIAGAFVGVSVAIVLNDTVENEGLIGLGAVVLLSLLGAFIVLVVVSALGSLFSWGYGYGYGWSYALLVGIPALYVGMTGLVSSAYVCWRASNSRPSRRHTP
ncbi:MAG TPA: hypothetical protein VFU32_02985 [Ktedonobacterales bacterium]|nr:hypothetical protein [Ktedonobacterales bacterium]